MLASHEEEEEVVEANTIDVSPTSRWICMKAMYFIFVSYMYMFQIVHRRAQWLIHAVAVTE
jgi:hypothetical protein